MPDRMASASLSRFLHPAKKTRSTMTVKKQAERFMRVSSSLPITHPKHDNNVKDGEYGKGITKRAMDDVPQIENLFGPREEQNSLRQRCLLLRCLNSNLQL